MKAKTASEVKEFTDIPNVGPATVKDFETLGICSPKELAQQNGLEMYEKLNLLSGIVHDPCMIDVFLSVVDFMNGARAQPWWKYTAQRKRILGKKSLLD